MTHSHDARSSQPPIEYAETVDGARIAIKRKPAEGTPVVFVHGLAVNADLWDVPPIDGPGFSFRGLPTVLHEVGHHAIGLKTYSPRCLEEYHAWAWALNTMREHGFNVTPSVERRMAESLQYAVAKAARRGLKRLPVELQPFWPPGRHTSTT